MIAVYGDPIRTWDKQVRETVAVSELGYYHRLVGKYMIRYTTIRVDSLFLVDGCIIISIR